MFSLSPGHLSSLLSSLRSPPPDLLLVSSCGSLAPCHSSLLSLLSPSLSSLLAQHTREQGEVLAISLPMGFSAIVDICNTTVETIPSYDVFHFTEESPTELAEQPTTTHETEQVTQIFYSQHGELKVEREFELFDKFDLKDEQDTPDAEELQVVSKSEEMNTHERFPQNQFSCPKH